MLLRSLFIALIGLLSVGCSSVPYQDPDDVEYVDERDPFEPINRDMWELNQTLDENILRPVAVAYRDNVNDGLRDGLYNMALNLEEPATVLNDVLQLKFGEAAENSGRFVVNSTVGVLGFFDVAHEMGLERNPEDFGQTMGVYGVGNGPFLMIPLMGPSAPRHLVGDYVDGLIWPLADLNGYFTAFRIVVKGLSKRIELIEQEDLLENSLDSYSFVKNAYFDNMANKVRDGAPPEFDEDEEFEDFLDEIDDFEELESAGDDGGSR